MKDSYTYQVDSIAQDITEDIRSTLVNRIRDAVNANQECFVAQFILQNPDVNLKHMKLCYGFKGDHYKFWIEWKEGI